MHAAGDLPHIDDLDIAIAAEPGDAWDALLGVIEASFDSARTARAARLLGCADRQPSGPRPLGDGSAFPGFHVESAEAARLLALRGSHRFSEYTLIFRIERLGVEGTGLRAETRAAFPKLKGRIYRALVIDTRAHVLVTNRILHAVKRRAERTPTSY